MSHEAEKQAFLDNLHSFNHICNSPPLSKNGALFTMDEINELEKLAYRILNYIEEQIRELQTAKDPNAENKLLELKNAMDSFRENYTNTEGKLVKFFATDDAKINIKTTLSGTEKYSNLMIYGRDSIYWNMRVNQTIAMFENLALKKFGK